MLDFGLARAAGSVGGDASDQQSSSALATPEGTVMGTPAYMSPKQARGRSVDKRTDICAFGCLLFEVLTGRRAFEADGMTDTLVRVLHHEPDWHLLPHDAPVAIHTLIMRRLQKDTRQRLRDIGDARITIDEALSQPAHDLGSFTPRGSSKLRYLALGGSAIAGAAYVVTAGSAAPESFPFDRVVRLVASDAHEFSPAISPDGKWVAFLSNARGPTDVWIKAVSDQGRVRGRSDEPHGQRESGRSIGSVRRRHRDLTGIYRVAVAGGAPEVVVGTSRRAVSPLPGPDGRSLFYAGNPDTADLSLWRRDLSTGRNRRLTFGIGEYGSPSISRDGRRLVATVSNLRQGLHRVPVQFDSRPVLASLTEGYAGDLDPAWSPDGSRLAIVTSRTGQRNIWWSRADMTRPVSLTSGINSDEGPAYSPDGSQVAFASDRGGRRGIWLVPADGGVPRLVAPARILNNTVSWSPDGKHLAYAAPVGDRPQIEVVDVLSGRIRRLPTQASANSPMWFLKT